MNFKERQQLAIQMVAILWKTACEYGSDDLYGDVREMMGNVITANDMQELEFAMKGFDKTREECESSAKEMIWYLEHRWKMQAGDAK